MVNPQQVLSYIESNSMQGVIMTLGTLWYQLVYKPNEKRHEERFSELIKNMDSERKETKDSFSCLSKSISNIKDILAKGELLKAKVTKAQYDIILERLYGTADYVFSEITKTACKFCNGTCIFKSEFSKLVQERRADSFHIWTRMGISICVMDIIEQIDKPRFDVIWTRYLEEIISICNDKKRSKEDRIKDVEKLCKLYSELIKSEYLVEINKRITVDETT